MIYNQNNDSVILYGGYNMDEMHSMDKLNFNVLNLKYKSGYLENSNPTTA